MKFDKTSVDETLLVDVDDQIFLERLTDGRCKHSSSTHRVRGIMKHLAFTLNVNQVRRCTVFISFCIV